jgi:hypothetical protein
MHLPIAILGDKTKAHRGGWRQLIAVAWGKPRLEDLATRMMRLHRRHPHHHVCSRLRSGYCMSNEDSLSIVLNAMPRGP